MAAVCYSRLDGILSTIPSSKINLLCVAGILTSFFFFLQELFVRFSAELISV
jgi:hypothetical protein